MKNTLLNLLTGHDSKQNKKRAIVVNGSIVLSALVFVFSFAFANNTALADNCNPYYGGIEVTPPTFLHIYDSVSNSVVLTITSTDTRTDLFTIYKTESGITTTLGTTSFATGSSATFMITPYKCKK